MRFRGKSIRRKIVALLLVPLVSLTALWGFATYLTSREAGRLLDVGHVLEKVGHPLEGTVRVIQQERRQSLVYLADPRTADAHETLRRHRAATDRALDALRADARDPGSPTPWRGRRRARSPPHGGAGRPGHPAPLRRHPCRRPHPGAGVSANRLIDPCYTFLVHLHTLDDVEMDKQARALVGLARAREMVAREDALMVSSSSATASPRRGPPPLRPRRTPRAAVRGEPGDPADRRARGLPALLARTRDPAPARGRGVRHHRRPHRRPRACRRHRALGAGRERRPQRARRREHPGRRPLPGTRRTRRARHPAPGRCRRHPRLPRPPGLDRRVRAHRPRPGPRPHQAPQGGPGPVRGAAAQRHAPPRGR